MYKLVNTILRDGSLQLNAINVVGTNIFIPLDPDNSDYKKYLAWVAEGNTALPADPLPAE